MRKLLMTAAVMALCTGGAYAADGDSTPYVDNGPYLSLGAGWNHMQDENFKSNTKDKVDFNEGWVGDVAVGETWHHNLRTEIEGSYRHNNVDSIKGAGGSGGTGDFHSWSAMVNQYYDFHNSTRWTPYVGAGVGASFENAHHIANTFIANNSTNDWDTEFAYQGIAGIDYQATPRSIIGLRYDYFATLQSKFDNSNPALGGAKLDDPQNHSILVTYRYQFGHEKEPAPQPAAMQTPAYAPPPPQPVVYAIPTEQAIEDSPYKVFFANDSSKITNNGQQVLKDAVTAFQAQPNGLINITSNTDTMGTEKHNDRLSKARAASVRMALLADGVSADKIRTVSNAERDLPIPTGDQVKEPRNRVVTIVLQ